MEDDADNDAMSVDSVPFGFGASAYGSENGDEEDVVPERILPFNFGYSLPDGDYVEKAKSPAPSYTSMESNSGSERAEGLEPSTTVVRLHRDDSTSSSDQFDSDDNIDTDEHYEESSQKKSKKESVPRQEKAVKPELVVDPDEKRHPAMTVEFAVKALTSCLGKPEVDIKFFKKLLWERYPERFWEPMEGHDLVDLVDKMLELCDIEISMKITLALLNVMNLKKCAEYLQGLCKRNEVRYELKLALKRKYEMVYEGYGSQPVPFESVYTDTYISNGNEASVNIEHEFREPIDVLKDANKAKRPPVSENDIFSTRIDKFIMLKGVPGCGKSFAVQRFILDWADGKSHQDIFFLLPLPFKELNQMLEGEYTVLSLVSCFYPQMKDLDKLAFEGCPVMFICDGLDDTHMTFQFRKTLYTCDMGRSMSVQVIMTNLFRRNLLHNAYLLVTSRAGALDVIPHEYIDIHIEVRGFRDEQREAYFRKTILDQQLAERVIAHIKSTKTLFIMCHLPLFCWIVSKLLQSQFQCLEPSKELPKTITASYLMLLNLQSKKTVEKLQMDPSQCTKGLTSEQLLLKLAKLAFGMLEKNEFRIIKKHWEEVGLPDSYPAVACSGLCMDFYREFHVLYSEKVCCFAHPTIQEFLAALHVFYSYRKNKKNLLMTDKFKILKISLTDLLKSAVDKLLNAEDSNLDIFLRFLFGLSVETNQEVLESLLQMSSNSKTPARNEITNYITKKIKEGQNPGKTETLMRCIDELNPDMAR